MENFDNLTQKDKDIIFDKSVIHTEDNFTDLNIVDFAKDVAGIISKKRDKKRIIRDNKNHRSIKYHNKVEEKRYKGKINKNLRQEDRLIEKYSIESRK